MTASERSSSRPRRRSRSCAAWSSGPHNARSCAVHRWSSVDELYDTRVHPDGRSNLLTTRPSIVDHMKKLLEQHQDAASTSPFSGDSPDWVQWQCGQRVSRTRATSSPTRCHAHRRVGCARRSDRSRVLLVPPWLSHGSDRRDRLSPHPLADGVRCWRRSLVAGSAARCRCRSLVAVPAARSLRGPADRCGGRQIVAVPAARCCAGSSLRGRTSLSRNAQCGTPRGDAVARSV